MAGPGLLAKALPLDCAGSGWSPPWKEERVGEEGSSAAGHYRAVGPWLGSLSLGLHLRRPKIYGSALLWAADPELGAGRGVVGCCIGVAVVRWLEREQLPEVGCLRRAGASCRPVEGTTSPSYAPSKELSEGVR